MSDERKHAKTVKLPTTPEGVREALGKDTPPILLEQLKRRREQVGGSDKWQAEVDTRMEHLKGLLFKQWPDIGTMIASDRPRFLNVTVEGRNLRYEFCPSVAQPDRWALLGEVPTVYETAEILVTRLASEIAQPLGKSSEERIEQLTTLVKGVWPDAKIEVNTVTPGGIYFIDLKLDQLSFTIQFETKSGFGLNAFSDTMGYYENADDVLKYLLAWFTPEGVKRDVPLTQEVSAQGVPTTDATGIPDPLLTAQPTAEPQPPAGEWRATVIEQKTVDLSGEPGDNHLSFNVSFAAVGPEFAPVFVIKTAKGYVRIPTTRGYLITQDRRLATRFDSKLWANTVRGGLHCKSKIKRITSKAEREWRAMAEKGAETKTYSWTEEKNAEARAEAAPQEGLCPAGCGQQIHNYVCEPMKKDAPATVSSPATATP